MELTSDYPVWSIINGVPASYPSLDQDLKCDLLVIGGGITGALVAFHLAEAGIETVLVDKRDIGTGSTSGSTGLLQYEIDVPLRNLIPKIGPPQAFRSYHLCCEAVHKLGSLIGRLKIECGFRWVPSLFIARHVREARNLAEECRLRRKIGIEVEYWDRGELQRRFNFVRPAALFSELGGQVDPHKLTHGLLAAGSRRGLRVFDRSEVIRLEPNRTGIRAMIRGGFAIKARRAVIAAGFESRDYVQGEAGQLKTTFALVTEPVVPFPRWFRRSLIWESSTPYLYLRTTPENRIIIGGEDVGETDPARWGKLLRGKTQILVRKFNALFPDVKIQVAYSWAGTFGVTKDGLPYIGRNPGLRHAYFALGYGGNGITYSLIAAELIRDDLLGRPDSDGRLFRFDR